MLFKCIIELSVGGLERCFSLFASLYDSTISCALISCAQQKRPATAAGRDDIDLCMFRAQNCTSLSCTSKSRRIPHPNVSKVLFLEFRMRSEILGKLSLHLELLAVVAVEWDDDAWTRLNCLPSGVKREGPESPRWAAHRTQAEKQCIALRQRSTCEGVEDSGAFSRILILRFVPASSTTWRFGKGLFGRQRFWNFVCCSVVVLLQSWWLRSFGFWLCFLHDHVSAHCQIMSVPRCCFKTLCWYTLVINDVVVPAFLHRRCLKAQFLPISYRDVYHLRSAMWRGGYAEVDISGTSMS